MTAATKTKPKPPKLSLTLAEASESTGLSPRRLREYVHAGKLKAKRTGDDGTGLYLFRYEDLLDWYDALEDA